MIKRIKYRLQFLKMIIPYAHGVKRFFVTGFVGGDQQGPVRIHFDELRRYAVIFNAVDDDVGVRRQYRQGNQLRSPIGIRTSASSQKNGAGSEKRYKFLNPHTILSF